MADVDALLSRVNALLLRVGFSRQFGTAEEACANASSFLVAVFESVFSSRVPGLVRRPSESASPRDAYASNAAAVINALADILPPRVVIPATVTGEAVASGDLASIAFLVSILDDASALLGGGGQLGASRTAPLTPAAKDALGALGESHLASATSAAATLSAVASPLSPDTPCAAQDDWLTADENSADDSAGDSLDAASSAPPAPISAAADAPSADAASEQPLLPSAASASADIWAGSTPEKVREKAAVRSALLGGSSRASVASRTSTLSGASAARAAPPPPPPQSPRSSQQPSPRRASAARSTTSFACAAPSPLASRAAGAGAAASSAASLPPAPPRPGTSGSSRHSTAGTERTGSTAKDGGASSMAAEIKALDDRRAAAVAAMSIRRRAGVIRRMAHANEEELALIATMTEAAIKVREAAHRVAEEKALQATKLRAAAAKHERKVVTLRARGCIENLMRTTLSMRIARSSRQAAASGAMLKTLAAQARLGAAEELRAAAGERSAMLLGAQGRVAWLNHTARLMNEAVLEETAKQVEQRRVATLSQRDALERALRELRVEEERVMKKMMEEQAHAEDAFLAQRVEPVARAAERREGEAVVRGFAQDATDTDADAAKVRTLARVREGLARAEGTRGMLLGLAKGAMGRAAGEAGRGEAEAEALEGQAQALMQQ